MDHLIAKDRKIQRCSNTGFTGRMQCPSLGLLCMVGQGALGEDSGLKGHMVLKFSSANAGVRL